MGAVGDAFEFALAAHAGQTDKAGMAYAGHLARVAAAVEGEAARVVALLHDVIEDCGITRDTLAARFGAEVAEAVVLLTRDPAQEDGAYYTAIAANPLARAVKLADVADNSHPARMAALDAETRTRLTGKYAAAKRALGA
jgi:(p)ppGpp synthase/HD superfamily hydrolase